MNVVLIGFMATGKSTVGRALARSMGAPFIDMDREIRRGFEMSVAEIFKSHGEDAFRQAETRLLATLGDEKSLASEAERQFPRRYVLSTGGGAPLREENRPLLRELGQVVWLKAHPETIAARCRPQLAKRPILAAHGHALEERIRELLEERERHYQAASTFTVWTDDFGSAESIAQQIRSHLAAGSQLPDALS